MGQSHTTFALKHLCSVSMGDFWLHSLEMGSCTEAFSQTQSVGCLQMKATAPGSAGKCFEVTEMHTLDFRSSVDFLPIQLCSQLRPPGCVKLHFEGFMQLAPNSFGRLFCRYISFTPSQLFFPLFPHIGLAHTSQFHVITPHICCSVIFPSGF